LISKDFDLRTQNKIEINVFICDDDDDDVFNDDDDVEPLDSN